jgi:hypothetical protein
MFALRPIQYFFPQHHFVQNFFHTNLNPYSPEFKPLSNPEVITEEPEVGQESIKMPGETDEEEKSKDFWPILGISFHSIFC